jgi:hypothetical protein
VQQQQQGRYEARTHVPLTRGVLLWLVSCNCNAGRPCQEDLDAIQSPFAATMMESCSVTQVRQQRADCGGTAGLNDAAATAVASTLVC